MNKWVHLAQRLLVVTIVIIAMSGGSTVYAADPYIYLYNDGFESYQRNNCVRAYSSLYAYYAIARNHGTQPASILQQILDAVHYCEGELYNAVDTKKKLDQYGNVTSITVDVSGKADGPRREVTYPFHKTTRYSRQRVSLPSTLH